MDLGKRLVIFSLIIVLLALLAFYWPDLQSLLTGKFIDNSIDYEPEIAFVNNIVDGDTIKTDIGEIRFLGVNTPERGKPYYGEAKDYLKQIENKSIEVLRDFEDIDKYGRKLRYVFYENRFINAEILQEGLATSFMIKGLKYEDKLKNAEEFAKNNEIGLWEKSDDKCADCIELAELNPEEEFFIIENKCNFECNLEGWLVKDDANHFFKLNNLHLYEQQRYDSKTSVWNDDGDRFFMRDKNGKLVIFYEY